MKINRRQGEIYHYIKQHNSVSVSDLVPMFSVSAPTIRKDLTLLEEQGLITRTYGEAHLVTNENQITPFEFRSTLNQEAKRAIAKLAAEQIQDGESIMLDSGTTNLEIARQLVNRSDLTVITNSLPIANLFIKSNVSVCIVGGMFLGSNLSIQGPETDESLRNLAVDRAFVSSVGIRPSYGLVTSAQMEASVKRSMLSAARYRYAAIDSSKFSISSIYPVVPFRDLDYIITEKPPNSPELLDTLSRMGVILLYP